MEYIGEVNQRLCAYRDLSLALTRDEVDAVERDLQDRFGHPPGPVNRMLEAVRRRIQAEHLGVSSVQAREGRLRVTCGPDGTLDPGRLVSFLRGRSGARLSPEGAVEIPLTPAEDPLSLLGGFLDASSPPGSSA
jgi:transcription-repair coupling factor (superfamily II helicase)